MPWRCPCDVTLYFNNGQTEMRSIHTKISERRRFNQQKTTVAVRDDDVLPP